MKITLTLCHLLLLATLSFAQLSPFAVAGAGKSLLNGLKDRKKAKAIESSISEVDINGTRISILRVPEEKIISNSKHSITKIQRLLEDLQLQYSRGEHINIPSDMTDLYVIQSADPDWPIRFYDAELAEYRRYDNKLVRKEARLRDSIQVVSRDNKRRQADSLRLVAKVLEDSIRYRERITGFRFVNKEFVLLKEKPSDESHSIGRLYLGSYVIVSGFSENSDYVRISLQEIKGYVKATDLVNSLDELNAPAADLRTFKSRQYYKYEPNYDYELLPQAAYSPAPVKVATSRTSSSANRPRSTTSQSRIYHTGPRGGCYYLTAAGNKVYVDRGNCN